MTLDEAGDDEEEKPDEEQTEKTSRSAKRKHDDDTGMCYSVRIVAQAYLNYSDSRTIGFHYVQNSGPFSQQSRREKSRCKHDQKQQLDAVNCPSKTSAFSDKRNSIIILKN